MEDCGLDHDGRMHASAKVPAVELRAGLWREPSNGRKTMICSLCSKRKNFSIHHQITAQWRNACRVSHETQSKQEHSVVNSKRLGKDVGLRPQYPRLHVPRC